MVNLVCDVERTETFFMDGEPATRWTGRLVRRIRGYGVERRPELDVIITRHGNLLSDDVGETVPADARLL